MSTTSMKAFPATGTGWPEPSSTIRGTYLMKRVAGMAFELEDHPLAVNLALHLYTDQSGGDLGAGCGHTLNADDEERGENQHHEATRSQTTLLRRKKPRRA
jgi:hypothetical protein